MEADKINREYNAFILDNRTKVSRYLNRVLWFFVITGPAIALGIGAGMFPDISYLTCVIISAVVVLMAGAHLLLLKKLPASRVTAVFALTVLDALIVYMSCSHVAIRLTWFLVPLLSLLFCDRPIFFFAVGLNYAFMCGATWASAAHEMTLRTDFASLPAYLGNVLGGYTIETVIMTAAGYMIGRLTDDYYKSLFAQYKLIREQEAAMQEKMNILDSMVEIYDNVNLINFVDSTEMSLRSPEQKKYGIDMHTQTHTLMNQRLKNQVMPDQLEDFLTFTNIKTVRARLTQRKIISADFIDVVSGWFRAQYITVDSTLDGIPNIVIYVTRNVDEEKRREEHLVRISMTDEMTRLYNRRCFEEDLTERRKGTIEEKFVLLSIDVNGLKTVNDTKGHAAGDELIKGAADCLTLSVGNRGRVYRTGGDEFMAILRTDEPEAIRREIAEKAAKWHGIYNEKITMSVGYAAYAEHPNATVDELERISDAAMYAEKERYYRESGIDRRK